MLRTGRITKIEKKTITYGYLKQGIKKQDQSKYDNSDFYHGSNGTYGFGHESDHQVILYLTVFETDEFPREWLQINIRDQILQENNVKRISTELFDEIYTANVSKKVNFDLTNGIVSFPFGVLRLKFR